MSYPPNDNSYFGHSYGPPPPTGPGGYSPSQGYPQQPPEQGSSGRWVIVAIALVAAVALGVAGVLLLPRGEDRLSALEDERSDRPTVKPWNEMSSSPTPEPPPQGGRPEHCPNRGTPVSVIQSDGRMLGGGLSIVAPTSRGWNDNKDYMPWMVEQNSTTKRITANWVAGVDVGAVKKSDGFSDPKKAAHNILSCMASSWLYDDFTGKEVLVDEAWSVGGKSGWFLKANVLVDRADWVKGDVVYIYVAELGRPDELAVAVGTATIDHPESIGEVEGAMNSIALA
ncbi:hypothetical protein [Tessaracoccus sp. OH4464_COT-324]|uniref:hypothetical protein n=1 Tax=Tessaracoccus sp. OH4464_COT-324 TaxID=2491059 RepID=UPI000F62F7B8|nr:hypothetical protein [Tessaracoccus sp. OH4464_COT-324]RRD46008.1 hypothetical protein EII42_09200 [Tessaracoccus sp. OH4464_COT-324]